MCMQKYLVNSTYCIYMCELNSHYYDDSICTLEEVIKEVLHEKGVKINLAIVPVRKSNIQIVNEILSNTDKNLLHTSKIMNYVLVTDDKKLIKEAKKNDLHILDTPHFLHRLLKEGKLPKQHVLNVLESLRPLYNRSYILDKVIKDITNWG